MLCAYKEHLLSVLPFMFLFFSSLFSLFFLFRSLLPFFYFLYLSSLCVNLNTNTKNQFRIRVKLSNTYKDFIYIYKNGSHNQVTHDRSWSLPTMLCHSIHENFHLYKPYRQLFTQPCKNINGSTYRQCIVVLDLLSELKSLKNPFSDI